MTEDVDIAQAQNIFSEYPMEMDKYIADKKFIIKVIPIKYKMVSELQFPDIVITSAKQCIDFIEAELKFWDDEEARKIRILSDFFNRLTRAKSYFENAKDWYGKNIYDRGRSCLNNLFNELSHDHLYSKTKLAQFFMNNKTKGNNYFEGLECALKGEPDAQINGYAGSHLGFIEGLNYLKIIEQVQRMAKEELGQFSENLKFASDAYAELNNRYTVAFHSQEQRIEEIKNKNSEAVKKLEEESKTYFDQKEKRCADLENLYENKLRIEKPADYWKQMHNMYSKKGKLWFGFSCGVAIAIVAMLICILAFVPNVFDEQSHWFDILKNSAIVTVVAGVAIYVLRIFVKMALSSFHLARDAKEREQLSYYYLSLIQGKAITDRERALIINSLFSRSDTGLLKGDAAPAMTTNIADIIETVTKK